MPTDMALMDAWKFRNEQVVNDYNNIPPAFVKNWQRLLWAAEAKNSVEWYNFWKSNR